MQARWFSSLTVFFKQHRCQLLAYFLVAKRRGALLGYEYQIMRRWQLVLMQPKKLTKTTLHSISLDGAPYLFADCKPQTRIPHIIGPQDDSEVFRMTAAAISERKLKFLPTSQALVFAKGKLSPADATAVSVRLLGTAMLVLGLANPSHALRRPAVFFPLPVFGQLSSGPILSACEPENRESVFSLCCWVDTFSSWDQVPVHASLIGPPQQAEKIQPCLAGRMSIKLLFINT